MFLDQKKRVAYMLNVERVCSHIIDEISHITQVRNGLHIMGARETLASKVITHSFRHYHSFEDHIPKRQHTILLHL